MSGSKRNTNINHFSILSLRNNKEKTQIQLMNANNFDMRLYLRRKHAHAPSVLLLRVPHNKDRHYRNDLTDNHRSHQQKTHHPPHIVGLHVNNFDIHDTSTSSFGWQRYSDKIGRISPAPDMIYRNTYLEEKKADKSDRNTKHHSSSPSLKLNNSFSYFPSESLQQKNDNQQYRTVYDYIRESIRQIEQQRKLKQQNLSFRVQRPQNEDSTFRRVLGAKTSLSRSSSTTTQIQSSLVNNDLKNSKTLVNYINHARVVHSTTPPNQSFEQQQEQPFILSQIE